MTLSARLIRRLLFLWIAMLFLGARPAHAVPPANTQLQPANGYGTVRFEQVNPTPEEARLGVVTCYRFFVTNTQQPLASLPYQPIRPFPPTQPVTGFGIKGLVVYHPEAPVTVSSPDRTSVTLYQRKHQYSWWDHNGGPDTDGNGIVDRLIEPGETQPGPSGPPGPIVYYTDENTYRLCYTSFIDPSQFKFGLHVVEPFTGETFFAHVNERPRAKLKLAVALVGDCVRSGQTATFNYTLSNTGNGPVTNVQLTDSLPGTIAGVPTTLAAGETVTLTRSGVISTPNLYQNFTNEVGLSGTDPNSGTTVTAHASITVEVVHPSLSLVKTASATTVLPGSPVTYTYTVTNTGDVAINNISVLDQTNGGPAVVVGTISTLAPNGTATVDKTVAINEDTTNVAIARGFDACSNGAVASNQATVVVRVINPRLLLDITPDQQKICVPGGQVTFTYTVTNPSDSVTLTNIVVTDNFGTVGTIPQLEPGSSAPPLTRTINATLANIPTISIQGVARATDAELNSNVVSNTVTVNVEVVECARILGSVYCADEPTVKIAGALVELVNSAGQVVQTVMSDANGGFSFHDIPDGSYHVRAQKSPDWVANTSPTFTYNELDSDVTTGVGLHPTPISFRQREALTGRIFFSDVQTYRDREVPGSPVLTAADLYNPAFASPTWTRSYRFEGVLPWYPELGTFTANRPIWVIIESPLRPENVWHDYSVTNTVYVEDGLGTGAGRARGDFTIRMLFNQPFDGPGTAYQYQVTGLTTNVPPLNAPLFNPLAPVQIGPSPINSPVPGSVPAGWMARTLIQTRYQNGAVWTFNVLGSYKNACGHLFNFAIHPDLEGNP